MNPVNFTIPSTPPIYIEFHVRFTMVNIENCDLKFSSIIVLYSFLYYLLSHQYLDVDIKGNIVNQSNHFIIITSTVPLRAQK